MTSTHEENIVENNKIQSKPFLKMNRNIIQLIYNSEIELRWQALGLDAVNGPMKMLQLASIYVEVYSHADPSTSD